MSKFVWFHLFVITFLSAQMVTSLTHCRSLESKYMRIKFDHESKRNMSQFSHFRTFSDLKMDCTQTYNITTHVQFLPLQNILVDREFSLAEIFKTSLINSLEYIFISNVRGFDLNSIKIPSRVPKTQLMLSYAKFSVYQHGRALSKCNVDTFNASLNFLASFSSLYFRHVKYATQMCPLAFRQIAATKIFFTDITNSLLATNRLTFSHVSDSTGLELEHLVNLYFEIYYESLTRDLLYPALFRNVNSVSLTGVLERIEADLFRDYPKINLVLFKISNLRGFFHAGTQWMNSLNSHVRVNLSSPTDVKLNIKKLWVLVLEHPTSFVSFDQVYEYPDEDLCLFREFPHDRLVYPILYPGKQINCSCTLKWLHAYEFIYRNRKHPVTTDYYILVQDSVNYKFTSVYKYCHEAFKTLDCEFGKKMSDCSIKPVDFRRLGFAFNNDVDIFFLIKWAQYVLLLIVQPILSFASIFSNVLVILVITNKNKRKQFKDIMYNYILIYAIFNILYCVIMILKLINLCVFFIAPSTCSSIYQASSSQYFKIVCVFFLGNVCKLCSNFAYLFFSFSRLISISMNKENKFYKKFKNLDFRFFGVVTVTFSCVLSSFILLQYETNVARDYRKEFPFETRNENFCQDIQNRYQCRLFNAFKLTNNFFNGILFFFLNVVIDLFLIKAFGQQIKSKSHLELNKSRIEEFKKKKKHMTKMVLVSDLIYFVSNIGELAVTLMLIVFSEHIHHFCNEKISCDLLKEEADVFILVSMMANFSILKAFNRNFAESFRDLNWRLCYCSHFKTSNISNDITVSTRNL